MSTNHATDETLTTLEAAKLLKASVRTVQLWVEDGRIKAWKTPGGHRRLSKASVEAMLDGRRQAINEPAQSQYEILVVEDDAIQMKLLQRTLDGITPNTRVRYSTDGYEALIRIGESRPDLLITDLVMPGLDGFRLLKTLGREQSTHPMQIIVVTSLSKTDLEASEGLANGVTVLHKPLNIESLQALAKAYHHVWQLTGQSQ